jgi:16S rRNA (guanine1207-N2)-methyltransferase
MLNPQSQLVLRNSDDLVGPLLCIEPMADDLAQELKALRPDLKVMVWTTDAAVAQKWQPHYPTIFAMAPDAQQLGTFAFADQATAALQALLFYPKMKEALWAMLAPLTPLLSSNSDVFVVGDNKGGIKSIANQVSNKGIQANKLDNAKHCLWFALHGVKEANIAAPSLANYTDDRLADLTFCSVPGVFNHGRLDLGTALLLQQLSHVQHGKVLDFACGAGIIATYLLKKQPQLTMFASDISALAIAATQATLALNNVTATVIAADGVPAELHDLHHIVANPPFHTGLTTDYGISHRFIGQSHKALRSGGSLTLVANSHLPYQEWLAAEFAKVELLAKRDGFVVYKATKA